jgi:diguanylate cyclase
MKMNKLQKIFSLFYLVILGMWIYIQLNETRSDFNYWYSFLFGLIPFFGGLIGMMTAKTWGGLKSVVGKSVFFFSLGLFLWGFGENIWSYYNFFRNEPAPYPSLADIGFAPSIFFWIVGMFYMAKASGAMLALKRSAVAKFVAFFLTVGLSALSYHMLINVARDGVLVPEGETALKTVLDIAYPLGDFLALTLAVVVFALSRKYLGGFYRAAIASLFIGLGMMYFGDFSFSYTTTTGTFYNGNWGDLLLASGLFFMTFGILGFTVRPTKPVSQEVEQA